MASLYGLLGFAELALAQAPDANSWFKEYLDMRKNKAEGLGTFPLRFVVVKKFSRKKNPKIKKISRKKFNKRGLLQIADTGSLNQYFALNVRPANISGRAKKKSEDEWMKMMFAPLNVDTIIDGSGGSWEAYQMGQGNELEKIIDESAPGKGSKATLKWFKEHLGYDGVVLDQKDSYFLIGTIENIKKEGTQALLLKDSFNKATMDAGEKGDGLLELKNIGHRASVFELILPGSTGKDIPKGSKIIIEKKK